MIVMSATPFLDRWIQSLPPRTREVMVIAGDTVEKFDGDVKMLETLAQLAFMRAVEADSDMTDLETGDKIALMKLAGRLIQASAKVKDQRVRIMDEFENLTDQPKAANVEYMVVETSITEQIKRLILVGMHTEAEMLARQNGLNVADYQPKIEVMETPDE